MIQISLENRVRVTNEKKEAADSFIGSPLYEMLELCITDVLRLFKLYRTSFYNWKNSNQKPGGRKFELAQDNLVIQEHFIAIVDCLGYVPGARTFHTYMYRDYNRHVSIERCGRLMAEMHLDPRYGRPPSHKAAKEKGTHCHPCAAVENIVLQDFYQGPRKIILTDITYLYIKEFHAVIYLCVFYDCFTKEALGWSVRKDMSTELVKEAYSMMMVGHGDELRGTKVVIHSDQGSQYTATTFKQLLEDDGFVQSMSERGNSQDNAPLESFFGRMKARILSLIALCQDFETAKQLIFGYLCDYNNNHYQFFLAGLTPVEFYEYTQTGVYPLPEYYGVKASELGEQKRLIDARIAAARKRNATEREAYKKRREREQQNIKLPPNLLVLRDQSILKRKIKAQEKAKNKAESRLIELKKILEKTRTALAFIERAGERVLHDLKNPLRWHCYPELSYVYDMNGMY